MGNVFQLNRKKVFTLEEAREILPVVRRITDDANSKIKVLVLSLESVRETNPERAKEIEDKINNVVQEWQTKVEKLGADGKGLWLVDFDCGTGYLCWKFPEDRLDHFHSYTDGFQGRIKIDDHVPGPSLTFDSPAVRPESTL